MGILLIDVREDDEKAAGGLQVWKMAGLPTR